MKRYFVASLCREGVLGGGILADDEAYTYRTNKLTVSPSLRKICLPYADIQSLERGWLLCFPTVTVHMKDETSWRFVVFRRNLFCSCGSERMDHGAAAEK